VHGSIWGSRASKRMPTFLAELCPTHPAIVHRALLGSYRRALQPSPAWVSVEREHDGYSMVRRSIFGIPGVVSLMPQLMITCG